MYAAAGIFGGLDVIDDKAGIWKKATSNRKDPKPDIILEA